MGKKQKKSRLVLGLIVGVAVFAAAFGMAATLGGIDTDNLGADAADIESCDIDGVTTTYTTQFVNASGYEVATVVVGAINDACEGQEAKVTLTNLAGNTIEESTMTLSLTSNAETFSIDPGVLAENVYEVHVVISGTPV